MKAALKLLALLLFLSCAHAPATAQPSPGDSPLRVGDVLTIGLPGEAALNKEFTIDRKGYVTLPEAGLVAVAGRTMEEATGVIREALSRAYRDLDKLSVALKERRLPVTVLGYVRTPGNVELPGDGNVQMALVGAGGISQGAQLDKMTITHADGKRVQFDYKKYLDSGDPSTLPKLEPLDVIFGPSSPLTGNVQIDFDGRTLAASGDGGEERSAIRIFGEVGTPGTFAYKKGATIIDLIMRAGGVTRYSAPEQVRILSKDKKPVVFNLQAYLDSGDTALVPELEPGSTIYVPKQVEEVRRGALTVYVMGEVQKPGAFETRDGASFIDIIANSGGPTRFADTRQIRIIRADGTNELVDLVKFTDGSGIKLPKVNPGDAIFVPEKNDALDPWLKIAPTRAVQVLGAVVKPGRYEWSDEMSIFDLLANAGGPGAHGDIAHIQILKKEGDKAAPIEFDLEAFLKGGGSYESVPKIHGGYVVMVPELPQDPNDNKGTWMRQSPERSIYVMGQVGSPGRYAFSTGLGFLDILTAANGPTASADVRNIRVAHRGEKGSRVTRVNLGAYFATGDDKLLPKVKPGDVIFVPDQSKNFLDQPPSQVVRLLGAIGRPGRYEFSDEMSILDLLAEAGGPTGDAMQDRIIVINMSGAQTQTRIFDLLAFAKTGDIRRVPVVRAGDVVYIPNHSQDEIQELVAALGNLASAASFAAIAQSLRSTLK